MFKTVYGLGGHKKEVLTTTNVIKSCLYQNNEKTTLQNHEIVSNLQSSNLNYLNGSKCIT